ncbi:hypothetical protein, partial [Victivallis sp.]|uniref:hypothetical protein n=1 Tax=Victivallis sp. TaxID=2049020 RepID=UPI003A8DCF28
CKNDLTRAFFAVNRRKSGLGIVVMPYCTGRNSAVRRAHFPSAAPLSHLASDPFYSGRTGNIKIR